MQTTLFFDFNDFPLVSCIIENPSFYPSLGEQVQINKQLLSKNAAWIIDNDFVSAIEAANKSAKCFFADNPYFDYTPDGLTIHITLHLKESFEESYPGVLKD